MSVKFCEKCGKPFEGIAGVFCQVCLEEEKEDFALIKQFLEQHPLASLFQVSTELNIPVGRIKRFLQDERLEIVDTPGHSNRFLFCMKCGVPINTGRFCLMCATTVNKAAGKHDDKSVQQTHETHPEPTHDIKKETKIRFLKDKK